MKLGRAETPELALATRICQTRGQMQRRPLAFPLAVIAGTLVLAGCGRRGRPVAPPGGPPAATTPAARDETALTISWPDGPPAPGKPARLRVALRDAAGAAPRPGGGEPGELVVVRHDLEGFQRLPLAPVGGGSLETEIRFPSAGEYLLYADFTPADGVPHVARGTVSLPGRPPLPRPLAPDSDRPRRHGPVTARLSSTPAPITAGTPVVLTYTLTEAGGPASDLRSTQGSPGRLVVLSINGQDFLRARPAASPPAAAPASVSFETVFPDPGLFRLYAQFDVGGKVRLFTFVVTVGAPAR